MTSLNRPELAAAPALRLSLVGRTHPGRVRDHNEDHLRIHRPSGLVVLADGMGGHNAGEVASALAAVSIENFFLASRHGTVPPDLEGDAGSAAGSGGRLAAAVRKANADVFEISRTHEKHRGMGTTVVALHVDLSTAMAYIAHVGDSRCYRLRAGSLEALTRDHSLIGDAIAWKPDITEAELAILPKNMISRAVGRRESVEVDLRGELLEIGDVFLLCSDGLSGMVRDPEILEALKAAQSLEAACDALIDRANAAGGEDNVTVALARVEGA
jgi:PPM family protein phosphatase